MIQLILDGTQVPVVQEPIPFRRQSPLLADRDGSIVYQIKVPVTPLTAALLGHPHRVSSSEFGSVVRRSATLIIAGVHFASGVMDISKATSSLYELTLGIERGAFYFDTQRSLKSFFADDFVEFGTTAFPILDMLDKAHNETYPVTKFCLAPVYNEKIFEFPENWISPPAEGTLPRVFQNPPAFVYDTLVEPPAPARLLWESHYTPFFYVAYVVDELMKKIGLNVIENIFRSDAELKTLCIYSNYIYKLWNAPGAQKFQVARYLPELSAHEFIRSLEAVFNVTFEPDYSTGTVRIMLADSIFDQPAINRQGEPVFQNPEVELSQRIEKYIYRFTTGGDDSYYKDKVKEITSPYRFVGNVPDSGSLPDPADYEFHDVIRIDVGAFTQLNTNSYGYYAVAVDASGNKFWEFYSHDYLPEVIGNPDGQRSKNIDAGFNPVLNFSFNGTPYSVPNFWASRVDKACVGNFSKVQRESSDLSLFFYRGKYGLDGPAEFAMPFVSSERYTADGSNVPGANYELRWTEANGLLEKFHKRKVAWQRQLPAPVKARKRLRLLELRDFKFSEVQTIRGRNFLPVTLEGNVLPNGTVDVTFDLLPI